MRVIVHKLPVMKYGLNSQDLSREVPMLIKAERFVFILQESQTETNLQAHPPNEDLNKDKESRR